MCPAYNLNKQGDNIQPWRTPFLIWNQSVVPCPVLTVASWPAYRFLKRQVRCLVFPSFSEFSTAYCDPHNQRLWHVNKAETDVCLELSCFFHDPADVGNWSLVPLPFLKPAWTSGCSRFTYCWSLAWRILGITLPACEMSNSKSIELHRHLPYDSIITSLDLILYRCQGIKLYIQRHSLQHH